jgi:hypothetical protein
MKLKLPSFIETYIVKFALSKSGPFIQKGVSLLAAYLVALLSQKVPGIEAHLDVAVITGIIWTVIDSLINLLPSNIIKKYGQNIQTSLALAGKPLKIDGLALSKTADAAGELVKKQQSTTLKQKSLHQVKTKNNSNKRKSPAFSNNYKVR